ncbi:MAG: acetylxylan esterase [Spirochaetes bacterium]|nr:acetylxylan esterase [Spirochaetota bacterium]
MVDPDFSCLEYWRRRYRADAPKLSFAAATVRGYAGWKREFRKKFVQCLGRMPETDAPLDVVVQETVEGELFLRKKVTFSADRYSRIPAYVFIPKHAVSPVPAIVCPHGHGRGKDDPAGVTSTATDAEHVRKYNYDYAVQFAKRGFVTLAFDLRCFGERVDDPSEVYGHMDIAEGTHWCDINFVRGMLLGFNLLSLHVHDLGRCIDYLQTLDEVRGDRIGCVGLSQGGTTTLFGAAYDERIKVAGVSGYLNSWKVFPLPTGQICGSQIVPGLLEWGDHPEVAGLISPRPMFLEFGTKDPIFPIEGSRAAYQKVREIYTVAGASDRLELEEFEGVHEFRGNRIFEFFERWL